MKLICSARRCSPLLLLLSLSASGCSLLPRNQVLLDPSVPHRLAHGSDAVVWARKPDGTLVEQEVHLEAGWWIASPDVLSIPPEDRQPQPPTLTTLGTAP